MNEIRVPGHCASCCCKALQQFDLAAYSAIHIGKSDKKCCVYFMIGYDTGSTADQRSIGF
jgi:hypothetical protein